MGAAPATGDGTRMVNDLVNRDRYGTFVTQDDLSELIPDQD